MRTAEEILNQFYNVDEGFTGYEKECFIKAINEARKEAIEEAAKKTIGGSMKSENEIKQSILSLIKELK
jgi:hypothetical protein